MSYPKRVAWRALAGGLGFRACAEPRSPGAPLLAGAGSSCSWPATSAGEEAVLGVAALILSVTAADGANRCVRGWPGPASHS